MVKLNRSDLLSIVAIIIALSSAYIAYEQNELTKELNHLNIDPQISCHFYYNAYNTSESPYVVIKNEAPIRVIDVGVKHAMYSFDKVEKKILSGGIWGNGLEDIGCDYMLFQPVLAPKDFITSPLARYSGNLSTFITIYSFDIDYYRAEDMKHYSNRAIFFIDNGKIFENRDFINNEYYPDILKEINSFSFPSNQSYPLISQLTARAINRTKAAEISG